VTTKKTKPRKAPGAFDPAVVVSPVGVQNILRPRKIQAQVVLRVFCDNINQDMTSFQFFGQPPCVSVRDDERDGIFWPSCEQFDPNSYCTIKIQMNASSIRWLSKLAWIEVNSFESLVLFYNDFPKDFGEVNKNCQKMLAFHCWIFNIVFWRLGSTGKKITRSNRWLSKLFSIFVFAFVEVIVMPFNCQWSFTPTFMKTLVNDAKGTKITGKYFLAENSLGQVTTKNITKRKRPCLYRGVKNRYY